MIVNFLMLKRPLGLYVRIVFLIRFVLQKLYSGLPLACILRRLRPLKWLNTLSYLYLLISILCSAVIFIWLLVLKSTPFTWLERLFSNMWSSFPSVKTCLLWFNAEISEQIIAIAIRSVLFILYILKGECNYCWVRHDEGRKVYLSRRISFQTFHLDYYC